MSSILGETREWNDLFFRVKMKHQTGARATRDPRPPRQKTHQDEPTMKHASPDASSKSLKMTASSSSNKEKEAGEVLPYVCVHCGSPSASLHRQLSVSLSSIQTTTCASCGKIVDPYAEREGLLVAIDCILLREEAYRHVLYNVEELRQLAPVKYFHFLAAWSILDTYLKWETVRNDPSMEDMGLKFQAPAFLFSLSASSVLGVLLQCTAIVGYLSFAGTKHPPSNLAGKVFLALLLPSTFSVVSIVVMIWENTKTVRILGSVLITYWQGMAVSVISNDISVPLVGILVGVLWRLAVSTLWLQPYPCVGLELNGWDQIPTICAT
jgi:hypothetical protein